MPFDFKKEYKEFYLPKNQPELVTMPPMNYVAVQGSGDPNQEGGGRCCGTRWRRGKVPGARPPLKNTGVYGSISIE